MTTFQERAIRLLKQILAGGGGGGGATIAATNEVLKGDGAGNGIAATPGTDFATVAQAAHSGGVIGTASFDIATLPTLTYSSGIVSGITTLGAGIYNVTLSPVQPDALYTVNVNSYDGSTTHTVSASPASKATNGFDILSYRTSDNAPHDPTSIEFSIVRLSQ